jgi:hypothetical protein
LPRGDHHDFEPLPDQVLDHRPIAAFDPHPTDTVPPEQGGDLGQPRPGMRNGGFLDPAPVSVLWSRQSSVGRANWPAHVPPCGRDGFVMSCRGPASVIVCAQVPL